MRTSMLVSFVGVLIVVGCATAGSDDTGSTSSASSFCTGYCSRVHTCDQTKDLQTCTNSCQNSNAATLPKLREDVVGLIGKCFDGKDCKTVLGGTVLATCSEEATASVAPSATATTFCDAYATASTKCERTIDKAACLTRTKLYSDATLSDAQQCASKACTAIDDCVNAALGGLTTDGGGSSNSSSSGGTTDAGKKDGATSSSSSSSGSTATCTGVDTSTACGACTASSCCSQVTQCKADSNCTSLVSCLQNCAAGDTTCQNSCQTEFPSGVTNFNAFSSCLSNSCSSQCQ